MAEAMAAARVAVVLVAARVVVAWAVALTAARGVAASVAGLQERRQW